MSKQIDEKIVSMQFDNRNFEKNAATSIKTIDTLKKSLNFDGASKGLDSINKASKNIDMNGLAKSVETVRARFSALEVMGVTALANITNSAVNAGKRMVESLTIAPIKDGFQEYEMTLNAVQTTMAATGKTAAQVEEELKKLDEYADKTVYSTADMLNNLPKFTNAGVELESATKAMIGIANATALAGGGAGQASIAFYNLGQAIGTGYLTRMDYNSINNAGIATMEWKNQMVEAAIAQGTLTKVGEDAYKAGNKTLTLQQLFIDGLQEQWATTDVMMKVFGDYGDETTEIGKKSYSAAQDIKTFSQMMESLKATAGTGWKDTWQIIFGGLDEAKQFWTGLSNSISKVITTMADARNKLLESALGKSFTGLADKIKTITKPAEKAVGAVKEITSAVKNFDEIVGKVISGSYGNGKDRFDKLTKEGYNWCEVQNKVNETLGNSHRYTKEQIEAQNKLLGTTKKTVDETGKQTEATTELNKSEKDLLKDLIKLDDAQLKSLGYSDKQIEALRQLEKEALRLGIPIDDFIDKLDEIDGRWVLIDSFKNIGKSLTTIFTSMGQAWKEVMPAITGDHLYGVIAGFHKLTTYLTFNKDKAEQLKTTFQGLFAALDLVRRVVGGGLNVAFKILKGFLGAFDLDILGATSSIAELIIKLREWIVENDYIGKAATKIGEGLAFVVKKVKEWIDAFLKIPTVVKFIEEVKTKLDEFRNSTKGLESTTDAIERITAALKFGSGKVKGWVEQFMALPEVQKIIAKVKDKLSELKEVGAWAIQGLKEGLQNGIKSIPDILMDLGKRIIEAICKVLGINSPSTVMIAIGGFIIAGLILGITKGQGEVFDTIRGFGEKLISTIKEFNWGKIFAVAASTGLLIILKKLLDVFKVFAAPLEGLGNLFEGVGETLSGFGKVLRKSAKGVKNVLNAFAKGIKANAFKARAEGVKKLAIAIAILAGSLFLISKIDPDRLWESVGALAALAAIIGALSVFLGILTKGKTISFAAVTLMLIGMSAAILIMANAIKKLGKLSPDEAAQGVVAFEIVVVSMIGIFRYLGEFIKGETATNIDKVGVMLYKLAAAMIIMTLVIKLISTMSYYDLLKGGIAILGMVGIIALLAWTTKISTKNVDKIGGMMLKISIAMLLMVAVCKLVGMLTPEEMIKGGIFMAAFVLFVKYIIQVTTIGKKKKIAEVSGLLIAISVSLLLLVVVCKLVGMLSAEELIKGIVFVGLFLLFVKVVVKITTIGNDQQIAKVGLTILALSVAIGILAGVSLLLGLIDLGTLAKGVIAVGILAAMMTLMIHATKGASDVKGTMIGMAIAIAVMAAAVAVLSFIDLGALAKATGAMSILMGMFALMTKAASGLGGGMGALIVMTVAIAVMAGALYLLSGLPVKNCLGVAASLSILMLSFSGAMVIISKSGTMALKALIPIAAMTLIVGALAVILGIMVGIDNIDAAIQVSGALSVLLLAMSASCLILSKIGVLGAGAAAGAGSLMTIVGIVAGVILAVGAIVASLFSEEDLDKLVMTLDKLGSALGHFIGGFIGGIGEGITSKLPAMAKNLSEFMDKLGGFIEGAKNIKTDVITGVASLVGSIVLLTDANIFSKIVSAFGGNSSFDTIKTQLTSFADAIIGFNNKLKDNGGIDKTAIEGAVAAGGVVASLYDALPKSGGWAQTMFGEKSLDTFATQMTSFADAIIGFNNKLKDSGGINSELVESAASAGAVVASIYDALPKSGGKWQVMFGEVSLSTFATQMGSFADAIIGFSNKLRDNGGIEEGLIETARDAGLMVAALYDSIPKSSGWAQVIFGEQNLSTFSTQMTKFGEAICGFSNKVKENGGIDQSAVQAAISAGEIVCGLYDSLPEDKGALQKIKDFFSGGTMSMEDLSLQMGGLADAISNFSKKTADIDTATITIASASVKKLADTLTQVAAVKPGTAENFRKAIANLIKGVNKTSDLDADKIDSFIKSIKKLTNITIDTSSITATADSITKATTNIMNAVKTTITKDKPNVTKAMTTAMSGIKTVLNDTKRSISGEKKSFDDAFKTIVSGAVDAIKSKKTSMENAGKSLAASAKTGAESKKDSFKTAGKNLGDGLVEGIEAKEQAAYDAGFALGQKAVQGEKDGQQSNSPSKLTKKSGIWFGEGLVNGIVSMGRAVYKAGYNLGDEAVSSLSRSIAGISNVINSDIDTQPTIRPVLDLSDISDGANKLNGMLAMNPTVGANISAITYGMRHQNGANDDVVSELVRLGKKLDNAAGDSYNINGVNYTEGSDVAEAIKTIVRAATMERRV